MSAAPLRFERARSVRVSSSLLALIFAVTVVGLPPAVLLLVWAWGRVELDDVGLRYRPFGGTMAWADVRRLGIGVKTGTVDRDDPMEITFSTVHALLRDGRGRTLAVHCAGFADGPGLLQELKRRSGVSPEPLEVSFPFNRLSFRG